MYRRVLKGRFMRDAFSCGGYPTPQSLGRILIHILCSTKNREPWLAASIRTRAFCTIAEVGRDLGSDVDVYRAGGVADHVHLAVQLSRTVPVADFVKKVRSEIELGRSRRMMRPFRTRQFEWFQNPGRCPGLL